MPCNYRECQEDWDENNPCCLAGEPNYKKCVNYFFDEENTSGEVIQDIRDDESLVVPWSGTAMGSLDLELISSKKLPFVIGVIGHAKSGKTTFLATLYMLLRGGRPIGDYQFAGSYTLLGWEKIAQFFTLNSNKKISFPPHTSANMARVPGLLHLLLKDKTGQFHDIIFTDAPGEWFTEWAKSAHGELSKGARWIDEWADSYIIIADTAAFKENIGKARLTLTQIIDRMKNTHQNRPTNLVWTKTDLEIESVIKTRITTLVQNQLPNISFYDIAVINRKSDEEINNILNCVFELISQRQREKTQAPKIEVKDENDFFFTIRK